MQIKNRNFNPLVSIVIPVYNGGDFLAQAVNSVLEQTYQNIEVLVINDGSDDCGETERIALSFGDEIRYLKKENGGVASALNMAIDNMSGEYFSWLSHDDLYVKDKIERQIEFLSSIPQCNLNDTIVYSNYYVFTTDSEKVMPKFLKGVAPEEFRYWLTLENSLHGCTLLIPKVAFDKAGTFNEQLRTTQDYDLWFRMAKICRFVHCSSLLVKARSHQDQGSIKLAGCALAECNALLSGFVRSLTKYELLRTSPHALSVSYARIAASMWSRGFLKAARLATYLSFHTFPQSSFRVNSLAIGIVTQGIIRYFLIKSFRRILPAHVRHLIRNWLSLEKKDVTQQTLTLRNMELKEKFSVVYEKNIFGGSVSRSGEGSDLVQTSIICRIIPQLIQELGVKVFLDAPCGDWHWMKGVNLPVERYIGLDIVDALIAKNQSEFGNSKVSFQCLNLAQDNLPACDLIFSRDCLVHLSFVDAFKVIANFKRSGAKYLLATTFPNRKSNEDLGDGFWRPLNKQLAPFNFPEPIKLINEGCTEGNNLFTDKCLGLWLLQDIELPESN